MSNFFSNHRDVEMQIFELLSRIHVLHIMDDNARHQYMEELRNAIINKPNLSAAQIAAMMTDDLAERQSIIASINGLGHAADSARGKSTNRVVKNPSMPELHRSYKTFTRRFVELADDDSVIGEYKVAETKYVYSIGD